MAQNKIPIEVAYALAQKQRIIKLNVMPETTVREAIDQSGILDEFKEINLETQGVGIFSTPAKLTDPLKPYDRIEIYRPLIIDPKEARKKRGTKP